MNPGDFITLDFLFDLASEAGCLIDPGKRRPGYRLFWRLRRANEGYMSPSGAGDYLSQSTESKNRRREKMRRFSSISKPHYEALEKVEETLRTFFSLKPEEITPEVVHSTLQALTEPSAILEKYFGSLHIQVEKTHRIVMQQPRGQRNEVLDDAIEGLFCDTPSLPLSSGGTPPWSSALERSQGGVHV